MGCLTLMLNSMSDSMSLAEVFLGFGGKTFYIVGTAFTTVGTIYGINKLTSIAIGVFNNLHSLLGPNQSVELRNTNTTVLARKDVVDGFTSFGRIGMFIAFGILTKMCGAWMGLDSTIGTFNRILYK